MNVKFGKLKICAVLICTAMISGSFGYVNDHGHNDVMASTVSDLESEIAANDQKIAELEQQMNDIDNSIANEEYRQTLIREKLDIQTQNLDIINGKINELNKKIEKSKGKIKELKRDIKKKQADIDANKEQFKLRLRAMYISGNDSLASALVGATDFYDALSKMELISQVAKHNNELIESLKTQLEQYEEAKLQLNARNEELNNELADQQTYKAEFTAVIDDLNSEYMDSQDYIDTQLAKKQAASYNIDQYEADNAAMDAEIARINEIAMKPVYTAPATTRPSSNYGNDYDDDDNDDYGYGGYDGDDDDDGYGYGGGDYDDGGDDDYGYEEPSGGGYSGGALSWPVPGHYGISSYYGPRWGTFHYGIDISDGNTMGAGVTAAGGGVVSYVATGCTHNYGKDYSCGCNGGYGNYLMIDHGNGVTTVYAHLGDVSASYGQYVSAGDYIGSAGSTGWSTGAHLHFEVRINGSAVDPTGYV